MGNRLQKLRSLMEKKKLGAVLISSVPNIIYLTNFSGFSKEERDAFLFITAGNQYIFTHGIYKEVVEKNIKNYTLVEMKRESPIRESLKILIKKHKIKKLGYETFDLRVSEYEKILKLVDKKILQSSDLVGKLRTIKTRDEIDAIKKACKLGDKAYSYILKHLRIGMTEKEVVFEANLFIRRNGADISFPTIVAFGPNSSFPHHVSTNKKLEKGNFALIDFGIKLNDYCSDMTRTVFLGIAKNEQKMIYQTVLNSQKKTIQYIEKVLKEKGEVKGSEADNAARAHIISEGFPNIPHSLGHGIGLEVHELPRLTPVSDDMLKNGMVFSIEPGIYLPAGASEKEGLTNGFGVRIEDLFAIVNNKLIPLTHSPKNLIEI